jgi:hypothetical protein
MLGVQIDAFSIFAIKDELNVVRVISVFSDAVEKVVKLMGTLAKVQMPFYRFAWREPPFYREHVDEQSLQVIKAVSRDAFSGKHSRHQSVLSRSRIRLQSHSIPCTQGVALPSLDE